MSFNPSVEVAGYLDDLAKLGIHGKSRADVVGFAVTQFVDQLLRGGLLKLRTQRRRGNAIK